MKLLVLLLIASSCALTIQGEKLNSINSIDNDIVFDVANIGNRGIQDVIEAIIEFAQKLIKVIVDKAREVAKQICDTVQKLVQQALEDIQQIRDHIEEIIEEIAKQNEIARECVESQRPEIDNVIQNINNDLQKCASDALTQAQQLQELIESYVESINDDIQKLRVLVKDCLNSEKRPKNVVTCIIGQAEEIKSRVQSAISQAKEAIELAVETIPEISSSTRDCTLQVVAAAAVHLQQIVENINKCIQENQSKPKLLN